MYRIEEVPKDELYLGPEEMLVPVTHFYKEMHNAFGIPFFLKIAHKEPYASIRQRIKSRLNVPDKEWEKVSDQGNLINQTMKSATDYSPLSFVASTSW